MSAESNNLKKFKSIQHAITQIKLMEYETLGYDIEKWIISFSEQPNNVDYINYSRVYVFNCMVDVVVIRELFKKINNIIAEDYFEDPKHSTPSGYLILKYPFSAIPESF